MSAYGTGQIIGILFLVTLAALIIHRVITKGATRDGKDDGNVNGGLVVVDPKGELMIVEEAESFRVDKMVFPTRGAASNYLRERIRRRDGA